MNSIIQQVFNAGLGLIKYFAQHVSHLVRWQTGCGFSRFRASPTIAFKYPTTLWGRLAPCSPGIDEHPKDGLHCVGFESYFFPTHAAAIFAKGKYPLLRKRQVTLLLTDNQYRGVKVCLSPNRLKPFMRIEVQERWDGIPSTGLPSVLTANTFYVKARSMIALSAFF